MTGANQCLCQPVSNTQEWWNLTPSGQLRTWDQPSPDPFKQGILSPLRSIPGASAAEVIKPDSMHCFHLGFGGDLAASSLVALCHMSYFGRGGIQKKMDEAFFSFDNWCATFHHTSSLKEFSLKTFKIKSLLDLNNISFYFSTRVQPCQNSSPPAAFFLCMVI